MEGFYVLTHTSLLQNKRKILDVIQTLFCCLNSDNKQLLPIDFELLTYSIRKFARNHVWVTVGERDFQSNWSGVRTERKKRFTT